MQHRVHLTALTFKQSDRNQFLRFAYRNARRETGGAAINEEFAQSGSVELMVVAFLGRRGLGDV
jgi:hypothetical protein